jgi:hypothetical protein
MTHTLPWLYHFAFAERVCMLGQNRARPYTCCSSGWLSSGLAGSMCVHGKPPPCTSINVHRLLHVGGRSGPQHQLACGFVYGMALMTKTAGREGLTDVFCVFPMAVLLQCCASTA